MYLCIYKRGKKYYFQAVKKITESFTVINEKMEAVKLGYKQKVESFAFNGWEDFKRIKHYLQVNYGLRMFVAEVRSADKTFQKLIIELMKNPFYTMMLAERDEQNEVTEDETGNVRIMELFSMADWNEAQKEFGFVSDFYKNIFTAEELPQ